LIMVDLIVIDMASNLFSGRVDKIS